MKKVLTFVVMLSCTLFASAQWSKGVQKELPSQFKQVNTGLYAHQQKMHKPMNVPADFQMPAKRVLKADKKIVETPNMARRATMANVTSTTDSVVALALGDYFAMMDYIESGEYVWYGYWWGLDITDTDGNVWAIQVQSAKYDYMAAKYATAYLSYYQGDDTVSVSAKGSFEVEFVATVESKPTYKFSGVFTDDAGNTYTLNANPTAYTFPEGYVYDYLNYAMCMSGYEEYCDMVDIELQDKEVTPSKDTIEVALTKIYKRAYPAGYYVEGYSDEAEFGTFLTTDLPIIAGSYTGDQINMANSFLTIDSVGIDLFKGTEANVTLRMDGTGYDFSIFMMDMEGDIYHMIGSWIAPVITDTITVSMLGTITDYSGIQQISLIDTAATPVYSLVMRYNSDTVTGAYTEKDSYGGGSYDMILQVNGEDSTFYSISEYLMFAFDMLPDNPYYGYAIFIKAFNLEDESDWKYFQIEGLVWHPFAFDDTTDVSVTLEATYDDFSTTYFDRNYGEVDFVAYNSDSTASAYLVFFVTDTTTDGTVLKPGVYKIGNTGNNIALKSTGFNYTYYNPAPCVLVQNEQMWFLVDGTITVGQNMITVDATNKNGKQVQIQINIAHPTALKQLSEAAAGMSKVMMNNRLFIINKSKVYNLLGNEVK